MAKTDSPPFNMKVEVGPRLAPATAFDAERLSSYRLGSSVRVQFVDTASRAGIRKWWAILNRAVRDCDTPWKTAQQASEAIKLSLGIVNLGKTVSGKMMQWPRSLTELDDAELDEAVQDMMDVLHRITGVDPADWRRETPDVGTDEQDSPGTQNVPPPGEGSGDASSPPLGPAPTNRSDEAPQQDEDESDEALSSDLAAIRRMLMEECIEDMLRDAFSSPKDQQLPKVNRLEQIYLEPQNLGSDPKFVKICAETARRIIGNISEVERAREYLKGLIR